MFNKEELLLELDQSTNDLVQQVSKCKEEDFNKSPGESRWSVGQVTEHILLLETSVNHILQTAQPTARAADLKIAPVKKGLDDLNRKFVAPEFIIPSTAHKEKQKLIEAIRAQRETLKKIIRSTDLTETPTFRHPSIGDMTRLEWVYFIIHHAARHVKQLENATMQGLN